jgi:hypothetical protein
LPTFRLQSTGSSKIGNALQPVALNAPPKKATKLAKGEMKGKHTPVDNELGSN